MTEPIKRKFGYKPDLPDWRDKKFTAPGGIPSVDKIDLRPGMPAIYDQMNLGSCLSADTRVPLLNGNTRSLKELSEGVEGNWFWVYSVESDTGKFIPSKATARKTRSSQKLLRIFLDNGESFDCTYYHKILSRSGEYIPAEQLHIGDSLMPRNIMLDKYGYELLFDNYSRRFHYTHRLVKYQLQKRVDRDVIHHLDFNKRNNSPENLLYMTWYAHIAYHSSLASFGFRNYHRTDKQREDSRRTILKQYEDDPNWNIGAASKAGKKAWENAQNSPERLEQIFIALDKGRTPESRVKAGIAISERYKSDPIFTEKMSDIAKQRYYNSPELQKICKENGVILGGQKSLEFQSMKFGKLLLERLGLINEHLWSSERTRLIKEKEIAHNVPKYDTALRNFSSLDHLVESAQNYNHKVVKIEELPGQHDVYCLNVPGTENFALNAGIYVHNCVSNSIAAAIVFDQKKQGLPESTPSRLFIYYQGRLRENSVDYDSGLEIRDGIRAVLQEGAPPESDWPYLITRFKEKPPTGAYRDATSHKVVKYERLYHSLSQMKACLQSGYPFTLGFTVYESFESDRTAKTGVMPMPEKNESVVGGHCFSGDTKISLLDGREVEIKNLIGEKEFWVYSTTLDGKIVPGRGHSARLTKKTAETIRVHLDNEEYIDCTPDHKFLLRNGTYCKARNLKVGTSLMPLYRRKEILYGRSSYEQVFIPNTEKWEFTHRVIENRCPNGYVRHHKDFNRFNNSPRNIEVMTWEDHTRLHNQQTNLLELYAKSEEGRNKSRELMNKNWEDPEFAEKVRIAVGKNGTIQAAERMSSGRFGYGEQISKEEHSALGKQYGSLNIVYANTPEAKEKRVSAWNDKFENDEEFRIKSQTNARKNIEIYNAALKEGKVSISVERREINRQTMLRLNQDTDVVKKRILKTTYTRFYKDRYPDFSTFLEIKGKDYDKPTKVNHKVTKIEKSRTQDVYDITVDKYHNFALSSGVFVHNCVLVQGYDDSKKALLVRNSWGTDWGFEGGNFWMPYDYALNPDLSDDFWCIRSVN